MYGENLAVETSLARRGARPDVLEDATLGVQRAHAQGQEHVVCTCIYASRSG